MSRDARFWLSVYALAIAVLYVARQVHFVMPPRIYQFSELMLSFAAGPVRRGALGEVFLSVSEATGISPAYLAPAIVAPIAVWTMVRYVQLCRLAAASPMLWPVIVSPGVFLAYAVNDFGGHKELFLFPLIIEIAYRLARPGVFPARTIAVCVAISPIIVLAHEALIIWLGYVLIPALVFASKFTRVQWAAMIVGVVVSCAAFLWSILVPGTFEQATIMCERFEGLVRQHTFTYWDGPCPDVGAFTYFWRDSSWGLELVQRKVAEGPIGLLLSPIPYFLPLLGLALYLRRRVRPRAFAKWSVGILLLIMVVMTGAVMAVAEDWGRFFALHSMGLTAVLAPIVINPRRYGVDPAAMNTPWRIEEDRVLFGIVTAIWAVSWAPFKRLPDIVEPLPLVMAVFF